MKDLILQEIMGGGKVHLCGKQAVVSCLMDLDRACG